MIRTFTVKLNGKTFTAEVEENMPRAGVSTGMPLPRAAVPVSASVVAAVETPAPAAALAASGTICAPMPAKVMKLCVKEGDSVTAGQLVAVLEAMKMENEIYSDASGTVAAIVTKEGVTVNTGDVLIRIQ